MTVADSCAMLGFLKSNCEKKKTNDRWLLLHGLKEITAALCFVYGLFLCEERGFLVRLYIYKNI